jgi:hypothetical protein
MNQLVPLPQPQFTWIEGGKPTTALYPWFQGADTLLREFAATITPVTVAGLPADAQPGQVRFAADGRKNGEGAGAGTGVQVYFDGTNWIASDSGAPVEA